MNAAPMSVRIDTHTHLYPEWGVERWLEALTRNLGGDGPAVVIITDRAGQDSFAALTASSSVSCALLGQGALEVSYLGRKLTLIRGVQYVSRERIEVLGLGVRRSMEDQAPAHTLVQEIVRQGGIPCLPWSPGKWLGKRGAVVAQLMQDFGPRALTLGDIAIRSSFGPPSRLLAAARTKGFRILYGSDPLSRAGEEQGAGAFGITLRAPAAYHGEELVAWVLKVLLDPTIAMSLHGRRNGPVKAALRMLRAFA